MAITVPDQNIAAGVKVPDSMNSLGNIMNVANSANQLQSGNLRLQGETQANDDRVAANQFMSDPKNYLADDGTIDPAKAKDILKIAPQSGPAYFGKLLELNQAHTAASAAKNKFTGDMAADVGRTYSALGYAGIDDPAVVKQVLDKKSQDYQGSPLGDYYKNAAIGVAAMPSGTGVINKTLLQNGNTFMPPDVQQSMATPSGVQMDNGQQQGIVSMKPGTNVPQGQMLPMPPVFGQKQLPPTTQTMVNGQPQYLGPQPAISAGSGAPVAAGPALGQEAGVLGPTKVNTDHYSTVVAQGSDSGKRIAQLQAIKEQIPTANMGHGGAGNVWRSIQTIFGSDAATANDVINKNIAMLASSGNTDAARTLQEMQTPNAHVTEKAAQEAADALIGLAKSQQKAIDFFAGTPTNSPAYAPKISQWNANASPRAFEFAMKSPADQNIMRAKMIKAGTWSTLQKQMIGLDSMGVSPE